RCLDKIGIKINFSFRNREIKRDGANQVRHYVVDVNSTREVEANQIGPALELKIEFSEPLVEYFFFNTLFVHGTGIITRTRAHPDLFQFCYRLLEAIEGCQRLGLEEYEFGKAIKNQIIL